MFSIPNLATGSFILSIIEDPISQEIAAMSRVPTIGCIHNIYTSFLHICARHCTAGCKCIFLHIIPMWGTAGPKFLSY